jgi:hypothetical protein
MCFGQYVHYNGVLRGAYTRNLYTTTIHLIASGLLKLRNITALPARVDGESVVYRGMGEMALPPDFFAKDSQGFAGGVEAAFMSTTTSKGVALHYSKTGDKPLSEQHLRVLFVFPVGERSLGADVSWLSQFPNEAEILYPPATHLQIVGEPRLDDNGVSVITVRPTVSQRSRTLEQVQRGRCEGLQQLGASLVSDVRFCARNHAVWELCKDLVERQGVAVTEEVRKWVATAYNDNVTYRDAVVKLIDLSEEGRKAVAERVREEGLGRWNCGDKEGALEHFRKAISVTEDLCADDKPRKDRLAGMLGEVAGMHGDSGVGAAKAKTALAVNLRDQGESQRGAIDGEYQKASELLREALGIYQAELSEEVRASRGMQDRRSGGSDRVSYLKQSACQALAL